jgi:cyclopropane-fatty-acyl-phospholipid synthase
VAENGELFEFGEDADLEPATALIRIHHPRFFRAVLFEGTRGLGEAYIRGYWSSPDLTSVVCLLTRSVQVWEKHYWLNEFMLVFSRLQRIRRRNTVAGSRKNIAAHYDLGNDFYALFLDATMTYSCAIFPSKDSSLEEAQRAKYDLICRKLNLHHTDQLLEIGCGWGGLAIYAAQHYGCRVTASTISEAQYEFARKAVKRAGLTGRVTLLCQDYRHLRGQFDKLVSIEMIEAVGHEYLDDYFRVCGSCLKPDGLMLLQAIIISDRVYDRYLRSADFIRSHVFPGGSIVSLKALGNSVARKTDLRLVHLEDLTHHYPETLRLWRERFFASLDTVRAQGFSEEFIRLWEFYFCYCAAGFMERYIGDVQLLYAKPYYRGPVWPSMDSPFTWPAGDNEKPAIPDPAGSPRVRHKP